MKLNLDNAKGEETLSVYPSQQLSQRISDPCSVPMQLNEVTFSQHTYEQPRKKKQVFIPNCQKVNQQSQRNLHEFSVESLHCWSPQR